MNPTRDESFVPLTPAGLPANDRPDYRVTVRSQADNVQPFHSLGQTVGSIAAGQSSNLEPRLTLQHEGDRIAAIRIQCTCGQVIELACVYEPAPAPTTVPGPAAAIPVSSESASPAALESPATPGSEPAPPAAPAILRAAAGPAAAPKRKPVPEKSKAKKSASGSRR
jgi:hypothetical protein